MVFVENVIDLPPEAEAHNPLTVDLVNDVEQHFVCLVVLLAQCWLALGSYSYMSSGLRFNLNGRLAAQPQIAV